MAKLKLTLACGNYDRTRALLEGTVRVEGVELNYLPLVPGETFWRMLNNEEFDVSEMSLSAYTILRSRGDLRFTALPVFPSRIFRHSCVYLPASSSVEHPSELSGRRLGVGDYQMTAAVWVRAFLQHDYGVSPRDLQWVVSRSVHDFPLPEGIRATRMEGDLAEALEREELDALISVVIPRGMRTGRLRRLFPAFRRVEEDYFRRTGIFPIMHTLVVRTALLEREPWLAVSLYKAFVRARDEALRRMDDTNALTVSLPWLIDELEASRRLFGEQIWDYSVQGSRPTLEAFVRYMYEQGLSSREMSVEELFAPQVSAGLEAYLKGTGED